jgi:hypothetical protein
MGKKNVCVNGGQRLGRLSGDASPYRYSEWARGKGGANRPGEHRAADGEKERLRQWGAAVGAAQRGRFALPIFGMGEGERWREPSQ